MVKENESICPKCGGSLKYYGNVLRLVRGKGRIASYVKIRRLQCTKCSRFHRELPDDVMPYKHYDAEIIRGVLNGFITPETYGYEDYPCEMTMKRWIHTQNLQSL